MPKTKHPSDRAERRRLKDVKDKTQGKDTKVKRVCRQPPEPIEDVALLEGQ